MTNLVEFVNQQKPFFDDVLTTDEVNWKKESQFAIQAMTTNDLLGKVALENPVSVQNAIINIAAIGISLNPALKHAYLVPRKVGDARTVCLDISYQGLLYLAMNTGSIIWGQAKLVYQNDTYTNLGLDKAPEHRQNTFGDKGAIVGAYCTVKTPTGDYLTEEMDIEALDKTKATSKAANGPWKNWSEEMQRKTVVKRASKYWPKVDQRLGLAINALNEHEGLTDNYIDGQKEPEFFDAEAVEEKILAIDSIDVLRAYHQEIKESGNLQHVNDKFIDRKAELEAIVQ